MTVVYQPLPGQLDLGDGHHFWMADGDGLWHDGRCRSWHTIDLTSGERHRLETADPLTIVGSLICRTCGAHGFIREGRWVPV